MDGILPWSDIDPYAGWDDESLQMHSQEADMQETDTINPYVFHLHEESVWNNAIVEQSSPIVSSVTETAGVASWVDTIEQDADSGLGGGSYSFDWSNWTVLENFVTSEEPSVPFSTTAEQPDSAVDTPSAAVLPDLYVEGFGREAAIESSLRLADSTTNAWFHGEVDHEGRANAGGHNSGGESQSGNTSSVYQPNNRLILPAPSASASFASPVDTTSVSSNSPKSSPKARKSQSSVLQCGECSESFTLDKDLRRHHRTQHSQGPAYSCKCGRETRRKDNFRRHIKECLRDILVPVFSCCCPYDNENMAAMLLHLACCGVKRRGRPAGVRRG